MSLQLSYGMTKTYFDLTHKLNSIESEQVSNFQDTTLLRSDALGVELAGLDYSVKGEDEIISILRNIDLLIPAGKITVILGASGSGKTTLVDLIAGLLSPRNGSVNFIDGRGNTSAAQQNLVGYCTQNPYIFDFGVQENLKLAVGNYKDESVNSIIEELNLNELSESYRTKSEVSFSRRISGGERQRIGIARVFLSNRPILVFDEPTSALDKDNASRFLHLLNRHRGIRTQIVVSHDFEIASISDHLVVLDNGDIIYQGKPSDYLGNKQTK
jgi:ABC-type transport system involved in cytochrome bd biosynthesis fused ATPase/permease subunit